MPRPRRPSSGAAKATLAPDEAPRPTEVVEEEVAEEVAEAVVEAAPPRRRSRKPRPRRAPRRSRRQPPSRHEAAADAPMWRHLPTRRRPAASAEAEAEAPPARAPPAEDASDTREGDRAQADRTAREARARARPQPGAAGHRGLRRDGQDVVVKVEMTKAHRKYKKVVRRSVKFHAHDEGNSAKNGDVVRIVETRPCRRPSAGGSPRSSRSPSDPAGAPPQGRRQHGAGGSSASA